MYDIHPDTEVLVLAEDGKKIGVMRSRQAKELANKSGLDLVIVARQTNPVVCKIMDEGKWRYLQKKKQKKQHKKILHIKEVKFGVSTAPHDASIKIKHIEEFLSKGHAVKVMVEMKGREKSHQGLAKEVLVAIISQLGRNTSDFRTTSNSVCVVLQPQTRHEEPQPQPQ